MPNKSPLDRLRELTYGRELAPELNSLDYILRSLTGAPSYISDLIKQDLEEYEKEKYRRKRQREPLRVEPLSPYSILTGEAPSEDYIPAAGLEAPEQGPILDIQYGGEDAARRIAEQARNLGSSKYLGGRRPSDIEAERILREEYGISPTIDRPTESRYYQSADEYIPSGPGRPPSPEGMVEVPQPTSPYDIFRTTEEWEEPLPAKPTPRSAEDILLELRQPKGLFTQYPGGGGVVTRGMRPEDQAAAAMISDQLLKLEKEKSDQAYAMLQIAAMNERSEAGIESRGVLALADDIQKKLDNLEFGADGTPIAQQAYLLAASGDKAGALEALKRAYAADAAAGAGGGSTPAEAARATAPSGELVSVGGRIVIR